MKTSMGDHRTKDGCRLKRARVNTHWKVNLTTACRATTRQRAQKEGSVKASVALTTRGGGAVSRKGERDGEGSDNPGGPSRDRDCVEGEVVERVDGDGRGAMLVPGSVLLVAVLGRPAGPA